MYFVLEPDWETTPKERTWDQRPGKEPVVRDHGVPSILSSPGGQTESRAVVHYLGFLLSYLSIAKQAFE